MRGAALALLALPALLARAPAARADQVTDALARARRTGKPVLLEFRADWCGPCVVFERRVLPEEDVQRALAGVELVRVDVDDDASTAAQRRYQVGVIPTFIALDASGRVLQRVEGIADFIAEGEFARFVSLLAARARTGRPTAERVALERAAASEAAAAAAASGTRAATHPLARAVLSGALEPDVQAALLAQHVASVADAETAVLATYVAMAAGDRLAGMAAARRAVELAPEDDGAHAALAYARSDAGLRYGVREFLHVCAHKQEGTPERTRCEAELERLMTGRAPPATRWRRQAADLCVRHAIEPGDADDDERRRLERLIDLTVSDPQGAIALDRTQRAAGAERSYTRPLAGVVRDLTAIASLRLDGGDDAHRALAGVHAILPWRARWIQVQPTAIVRAEAGADGDGVAAYDGAALVGFSVAGVIGIYSGIGINDPGAGARPSMSVPIEVALSTRGRRSGVEAFARTSWTSWSRPERGGGAENAPGGADEVSLGLAARLPGPFGRSLLLGVRYDEVLDQRLVGVWLGADMFAR